MGEVASMVLIAIMVPSLGGGFALIIKVIRDNARNQAENTMIKEQIAVIHGVVMSIKTEVANISHRLDVFTRTETDFLKQAMNDNTAALKAIVDKI